MNSREGAEAGPADPLAYLEEELSLLEGAHRLRTRPSPRDADAASINLCSNDYLGYAARGALRGASAAALSEWTGSTASRLVCGEHAVHGALERSLAAWLRAEDALVFTSGYAANVGALSSLLRVGDVVVSDRLNHASLIDGCRLSKAEIRVCEHLDIADAARLLEGTCRGRKWLVTESCFSMDGDVPDLEALRRICDRAGAALYVDEAHALGLYGPEGRGLCAERAVRPDVLVATLGKALGSQGAFVAGSRALCGHLWNRARSFVYSTGMSPLLASIARAAVELARSDEEGRREFWASAVRLRRLLLETGAARELPLGPVMPVLLADELSAVRVAARLADEGVRVQAIRPPTVPAGTSRLRFTVSALSEHEWQLVECALRTVFAG